MTTVNSIFPGFLPSGLYKSLNTSSDPELQALLAASTLLAQPETLELIGKAVAPVVQAIASNPQEAAKLAREASGVIFPLIKGVNKVGLVDDGTTSVTETTTTTRREKRPNGSRTTTTKITTTDRTIDPEKQQKKLEHDLRTVEDLFKGLEEGKIQVGDESVTIDQVKKLVGSLTQFVALVERQNLNKGKDENSSPVIDIGENDNNPPTPKTDESPKLDLGPIGDLVGGEHGLFTLLSTLKPETLGALTDIIQKVKAAKEVKVEDNNA